MRTTRISVDRLRRAFQQSVVLRLTEMMEALGTHAKMTVFRKLRELDYRASYSHAGKYYTLDELAHWDANGLWVWKGIRFSRHGTLLVTLRYRVDRAPAGCFAEELERELGVRVHNALSTLHRRTEVVRQQIGGAFLYTSTSGGERQLQRRRQLLGEQAAASAPRPPREVGPEVEEALPRFLATLNERQRRLYAGFESLKLGWGGDSKVAALTGLNVKTVARGRRELVAGAIDPDRVRAPGAGRPSVKKNRAGRRTGGSAGR